MKLGGELLPVFLEQRFNGPVLDRLERANLALPFYQQSQCNSLDASGGNSLLDRFPEHWAGFVADQSVQTPTRLLGVDFSFVDFAGVLVDALLPGLGPPHARLALGIVFWRGSFSFSCLGFRHSNAPACCRRYRTNLPGQFLRAVRANRRARCAHRIASALFR